MNPLPYESKFSFYGDEWLEFHDYLDNLGYREGVFIELTFGIGLINPRELAFKVGAKAELLNRIKCMVEVNRESDTSKHETILKKYHIVALPQPVKDTTDSMYK